MRFESYEIQFGRNSKRELVEFNRELYKGCVLHLVDIEEVELIENEDEIDNLNNLDNLDGLDGLDESPKITASQVEDYLTDQLFEIWSYLRPGDLIENTAISGYRLEGLYVVEVDDSQKDDQLVIKNGLKIVEVENLNGCALFNFNLITDFPLGYHNYDRIVINPKFSKSSVSSQYLEAKSYWDKEYYAPLDKITLHLSDITIGDVHRITINKVQFIYVVIEYRGSRYVIGSYLGSRSKKEFIKLLNEKRFLLCTTFDEDEETEEYYTNIDLYRNILVKEKIQLSNLVIIS